MDTQSLIITSNDETPAGTVFSTPEGHYVMTLPLEDIGDNRQGIINVPLIINADGSISAASNIQMDSVESNTISIDDSSMVIKTSPMDKMKQQSVFSSGTQLVLVTDETLGQRMILTTTDGKLEGAFTLQQPQITNTTIEINPLTNITFSAPNQQRVTELNVGTNFLNTTAQIVQQIDQPVQEEIQYITSTAVHRPIVEEENRPPIAGPHRCKVCHADFKQWAQKRKHELKHMMDKPYQCRKCSFSFNFELNLQLHEVVHLDGPIWSCPICERKFRRLAGYKAHIFIHEKEESLTCELCGDEFPTQKYLDLHITENHKENGEQFDDVSISYECTMCKRIFSSCTEFKTHMKDHTKLQKSLKISQPRKPVGGRRLGTHKCNLCDKRFAKPSLLKRHWLTHSGERPHKCDKCDQAFSQRGSLLLHQNLHKGEKPYKCTFCTATFVQRGNLRSHISRTHAIAKVGEFLYQCQLCTCKFKKVGSLNTHVTRYHSGSSEVQKAQEEPKMTPGDSDILQQAIAQSGLENAQSTKAEAAAPAGKVQIVADSTADGSTRHYQIKVRRHGGFRWHQCMHCVKEFKKPSDLIRHLRTHTNEKPYRCYFCQKSFTVRSTLSVHLHTHLPQKTAECSICQKKYSTAASLAVHLKSHVNAAKTNTCLYCEQIYPTNKEHHHCEEQKRQILERRRNKIQENKLLEEKLKESLPYLHDPLFASEKGIVAINRKKGSSSNRPEDYAERPYMCTRCSCRFKKLSHLKSHEESHDGIKKFLCDDCGKAFTSKPALKLHIVAIHTKDGKTYDCNECNLKYTCWGSLKRHMLCHAPHKSYFCPYCEKQFSYSSACRQHIKTHAKEVIINSERSKHNLKAAVFVSKVDPLTQTQTVVEFVEAVEQRTLSVINPPGNTFDQPIMAKYEIQVQQEPASPEKMHISEASKAVAEAIPQLLNAAVSGDLNLNMVAKQSSIHGIGKSIEEYSLLGDQTGVSSGQGLVPVEAGVFIQGFDGQTLDPNFFTGGIPIQTDPIEMGTLTKMLASTAAPDTVSHDDLAQYSCDICKKIFMDNETYKLHYDEEHSFVCEYCDQKFETEKNLRGHISVLHEAHNSSSEVYKCVHCCSVFKKPKQLQTHINKMHAHSRSILKSRVKVLPKEEIADLEGLEEISPLQKKEMARRLTLEEANDMAKSLIGCPKTSVSENVFLQSLKEVTVKDELETTEDQSSSSYINRCHLCPKSFKKPSDLIRHLRTHTGEKPFVCSQCGKGFAVRSTLVAHWQIHKKHATAALPCHICQAKFSSKGSLRVHMRIHTGARPLKCMHCPLSFRTSGHRKAHISAAHKALNKKSAPEEEVALNRLPSIQEEPELEPEADGVMEVEEAVSTLHQDQDQTDVQIPIPINMESSEFLQLDENIIQQVHSGNFILYPSDSDGFIRFEVFSDITGQQLIGEIAGSNIEVPQPKEPDGKSCLVCGKSFNKPSQLTRHMRIHSGEKPFPCNLCEKRFNQKNALNAHLLTHTGIKKYGCELCGKFFTQAGNLKVHVKRTHKSETTL
ncbi:zinc finger protein 236-like [Neocloeon triangulifer]|uniref:zinc finger protein 236-like n=1 Tax=Neocloeon triangulifer TaxID=2078957 RepID=UPI00286F6CD1|nr:zinc finger protein 236-like [Neocloeon triangulifer]